MSDPLLRPAGLMMLPRARMARAEEKRQRVLALLLAETWTVFSVLQKLLGLSYSTTHALMKAMEREGLTRSRAMFVPGRQGVSRMVLHGLTAHGLAMAQNADGAPRGSVWEPSKTSAIHVMHQVLTQEARLRAEAQGWTKWRPSRAMADMRLAKIPDADAVSPDGVRVAVEVERFLKTQKRYEAVLGAYIYEIRNGHWARVDYLCPDEGFAERMARALGRIDRLRLERNGQVTRTAKAEPAHLERFRFYVLSDWPAGAYKSVLVEGGDA